MYHVTEYSPAKTGEYSPVFKTKRVAKNTWKILNTMIFICRKNNYARMFALRQYLFSEQVTSANKYAVIFSCQMEAIVDLANQKKKNSKAEKDDTRRKQN